LMMRIFNTWRIRRTEKRLRALPDRYRQTADDEVRTAIIDEANVRLAMLELDGVVTKAERLAMGREWCGRLRGIGSGSSSATAMPPRSRGGGGS
jgi:hypothetical protein